MNKYSALLLSILLLIPCAEVKPMHRNDNLKDTMLLVSMIAGLAATGYGFFRFLTWLKPIQPKPQLPNNIQIIDNVTAVGDVCVRQAGGDNTTQVVGNVVGGNISIAQDAGENNSTQVTGNVVGGSISINQSGGKNHISGNSITTGSFVASQGQPANDNIDSTKTKSMILVGDQFLEKIMVSGIGQLLISQNTSLKRVEASITAEKGIIDNFSIVKEGTNLIIGPKKNTVICSTQPVIYKLYMPEIPQLSIQGNMAVQFITGITQDRLRLDLQDNGSVDCRANCPINVKKIITVATGRCSINVHGKASKQKITLHGNAEYNAQEVRSSFVKIDGFGNREVRLSLEDSLYGSVRSEIKGELHGNKRLLYQGNPINNVVCYDNAAIEHIK